MFRRSRSPDIPHDAQDIPDASLFPAVQAEPANEAMACTKLVCANELAGIIEHERGNEILLDELFSSADRFFDAYADGQALENKFYEKLAADHITISQEMGANHKDRRHGRRFIGADVAAEMSTVKNTTVKHIQEYTDKLLLEKIPFDEIARHEDTQLHGRYKELLLSHLNEISAIVPAPCTEVITWSDVILRNPYQSTFLLEQVARLHLAEIIHTLPETAEALFHPDKISTLPVSMQTLLALDLSRPHSSGLIYPFMKQRLHESTDDIDSTDYLREGAHTPKARTVMAAIALGSCLADGPTCSQNQFGLCEQRFAALSIEELPSELSEDLRAKYKNRNNLLLKSLERIPATMSIDAFWQVSKHMAPAAASKSTLEGVKKRASRRDASETEQEQATVVERLTPSVTLRLSHSLHEFGDDIKSDNSEELEAYIDNLLESKMFQKYLTKYQGEKGLEDLLRRGIASIMAPNGYLDNPAIIPMPDSTIPTPRDGTKLSVMRLSGQDFPHEAGKVGRDTRIYFGVGSAQGAKRIHIIGPRHKTDVAKDSRRGQLHF